MQRIVIDPKTSEQLRSARGTVVLCEPDGRVLGYFHPEQPTSGWSPDISEEELDRRECAGGGRPLKDILADLEGRQ
jgi:hypothetical protein